ARAAPATDERARCACECRRVGAGGQRGSTLGLGRCERATGDDRDRDRDPDRDRDRDPDPDRDRDPDREAETDSDVEADRDSESGDHCDGT
ncbi:MAG TPA: hypothetical protein VMI75_08025, partial [Polyangiaceae bacterium]|nr:hypothetical protein [Polyangiaceae bacterium]